MVGHIRARWCIEVAAAAAVKSHANMSRNMSWRRDGGALKGQSREQSACLEILDSLGLRLFLICLETLEILRSSICEIV